MLSKFLAYKVLPGVVDNIVRRAKVCVNLAESKYILGVFHRYVLQLTGGLELSGFVNYIEY